MVVRWTPALIAMLAAAAGAHGEVAPSARTTFEGVWKRAQCNQEIGQALNNVQYHDLGAGYSLGRVLCWMGPYQQSEILFLVAPKTGGRPQLLTFQEWRDGQFVPADVLVMADYAESTRMLTSFNKFRGPGDCGALGNWLWSGTEFRMTDYWYKPKCDGIEFDTSGDSYRIFPPQK
jgi:hypothetical protein